VSAFMEYINASGSTLDRKSMDTLVILLAPMAPHLAEELWQKLGNESSVFLARWPEADPAMLVADQVTVAIQVNGKTRGTVDVAADASEDDVKAAAEEITAVKNALDGKQVVKTIYVPGKIMNLVAK